MNAKAISCSGALLVWLHGSVLSLAFYSQSWNGWDAGQKYRSNCSGRLERRVVLCSNSDDNDKDALKRKKQAKPKKLWWSGMESFPFDCTSCGKCCKTTGYVYMSPTEITNAAKYLEISEEDFITTYASNTLQDDEDSSSPMWIELRNSKPTTSEEESCIFLDRATNQCQIYPVRPIQCSTYPFWPNVLQSRKSWNDEVRRKDDEIDRMDAVPVWTSESGGCEGMDLIEDTEAYFGGGKEQQNVVSVPEVYEKLLAYYRNELRFPFSATAKPVSDGNPKPVSISTKGSLNASTIPNCT